MTYASEVLADTPAGYWKLNEASGNAADSSGNTNTLTVSGSPIYGVTGPVTGDNAINLNGSGRFQGAVVGAAVGQLAIEFWIKLNSTGAVKAFISNGNGSSNGWRLLIGLPATDQMEMARLSGGDIFDLASTLTVGAWKHVVVSRDADGSSRGYYNGTLIAGPAAWINYTPAPTTAFTVGNTSGVPFQLAHVAYYGHPLSAARAAAHYAAATAPPVVTPVADFTGTPVTGTAPLSVAFTDTSTNTPTSWAWTFGDGGNSTVKNPSHTYSAAGTYTVALVATNTAGSNTKTRTAYVAVASASIPGVSIAFGDPWDEPDPTWTRLDTLAGCRVRGWTIDRGRPNEFAKTGTGTAVVRIADLDGLFDPTNATSPYYPNVLPGRQAVISLYNPVSSTWHIRFRGFVEAWRYVLSQTREHMELQLDLVDGFAMLARAELRVGVDGVIPLPAEVAEGNVGYAETTGPVGRDRIQAILGDVGWPYEWRVGDADPDPDIFSGNVRVGPKVYGAGTSALDAIWDAADADFPGVATVYCSANGHITFHGRQARFRPTVAQYGITLYNVGDLATIAADAAAVPVSELEWAIEDSQIYNACIATPEGVGAGTSWRQLDPAVDDVAGQLVTDEPSRAAYGLQSLTFDNLQTIEDIATGEGSLAATRKFATYYVANYKDPHVRISRIVFKSRRPGADHGSPLWAFLNNVEISDLLTVKTAHGGGGGFLREFFVEGIHYTCRPGAPNVPVVELSLDVSPREHWSDGSMFEDDA